MGDRKVVDTYRDLVVWKKAMRLSVDVYRATSGLPSDERFGLTSQMRRASSSIAANIAEGHDRGSTNDFVRFLWIANGSRVELETHLMLAGELGFLSREVVKELLATTEEIGRMLVGLRRSLDQTK